MLPFVRISPNENAHIPRGFSLVQLPIASTDSPFAEGVPYEIPTPTFVYSERSLEETNDLVREIRRATGCRVLYAMKAMPFASMLQAMEPALDGFAASSLFEAQLARALFPWKQLHFTTPGLRPHEVGSLSGLCDYITLNSVSHVRTFGPQLAGTVSLGLRLNTQLSFVEDERYNPCRTYSKLGVPLSQLENGSVGDLPEIVRGLHIHTNADSTDLGELEANVSALCHRLPSDIEVEWVNLGGGYLFSEMQCLDRLVDVIQAVRKRFDAEVFLEPGAALVRNAALIVSQVIDLFEVDGRSVAVLDTSVNHLPEVLEFGYQPEVMGQLDVAGHEYILAGSTCLAGDVFGAYRLRSKLDIGTRVVFTGSGAYTLAKAHRFNGVNLPTIYALGNDGTLRLCKQYTFQHYKDQWMPDE